MPPLDIFAPALARWALIPDGPPLHTASSALLPVCYGGQPAMLKIAHTLDEQRGATLMAWWAGQGAARVLAHAGAAVLLERIESPITLAGLVDSGQDDEASRIICATAAHLHTPRAQPHPVTLIPLATWFEALEQASAHGGVLRSAAVAARSLLTTPHEVTVLHGDLHHGNVLDAGPRGWLAIDPKGLVGERAFDFANIFCNPGARVPTAPGRLLRQVSVVAQAAHLAPGRLLQWVLAYAGLSAAWLVQDHDSPALPLAVAQLAADALQA